ncbi:MAG: DUF6268 family outer membrane beta-barrel protein [Chthoniobacterales bacterium]
MKTSFSILALSLAFLTAPLFAGSTMETSTPDETSTSAFPFEFHAEYGYLGDSDASRGYRTQRDFNENYYLARFIYTPRIAIGILRLGVAWERFDFNGFDPFVGHLGGPLGPIVLFRSQLPEVLQSVSAVVGLDTRLGDSLLLRFEAQPGLYGTRNLDSDSFRIPFLLGGTYVYSPNLQFVFGASVDYDRAYPVVPGGGVRWRFAPQWVLDAVVPTPRLDFEVTKSLTLYGGADLKGGTYRVTDDRNGIARSDARLRNALLTYSEVRAGLGIEFKVTPKIKFSAEGGYVPYRNFDYSRADVRYHQDNGGAYGAVSLNAAF